MGFRINTNVAAMDAHQKSTMTNRMLDKSLGSLASGLRINSAADDASGLVIADNLRSQANSLGQAIANANDAIGVIQTADKAMDEQIKILDTIKTKAIQAASDGQNLDSRKAIQADIDRLLEEAQNIASTTSFNGQTLLNGGFQNNSFHIGAYAGESVNISIDDTQIAAVGRFALAEGTGIAATTGAAAASSASLSVTVTHSDGTTSTATGTAQISAGEHSSREIAQAVVDAFNAAAQTEGTTNARASVYETSSSSAATPLFGIRVDSDENFTTSETNAGTIGDGTATGATGLTNNLSTIDVTTREAAEKAVIISDYALKDLDERRSDIGSVQNQLESTIRNISTTQVNVAAAESQIRDVDFAAESANFAKLNILAQSGSYALSQANAVQQNVLRLLQ